MQDTSALITSLVTAFIGLAFVSVILSQRANTVGVLGAFGSTLSGIINSAVAPITGGGSSVASTVTGDFGNPFAGTGA